MKVCLYVAYRSESDIRIILRSQVHTEECEKFRNHIQQLQKRIYFFPYSAHSTPSELREMLEKLKPIDVIPINVSENNDYAQQFVNNITSMWTENLPMTLQTNNTQDKKKLCFWKNLGNMENIMQSDYFSYCKPLRKTDIQLTEKTNKYVNMTCDKIISTNQETDKNMSSEHKQSINVLNGQYKKNKLIPHKRLVMKGVSRDTRQRRRKLNEAKLKEMCRECTVQITDLSSTKLEYMKYLSLKPRTKM